MRAALRLAAVTATLFALASGGVVAQPAPMSAPMTERITAPSEPPRVDMARLDLGLRARALADGVYVIEGANADFSPANGCNIINTGFIVTDAGVVVVNTGPSRRYGEQQRALIERTTGQPVVQVVHLNLHPDYFLGNQAYADLPRRATEATRAGMAREAAAYETNLYRLCGDWMKGTQALLPDAGPATSLDAAASAGVLRIGGRELLLQELRGHTDSDLVLIDRRSGVAFIGGLAFADRIPTTPHARIDDWLASLTTLAATLKAADARVIVPSHGPVRADTSALFQTRDYLRWLDHRLRTSARNGLELAEVLKLPVPAPYKDWAAVQTEYLRNVVHLFPGHEQAVLGAAR
ncbi:quinoprotein relay system zinc metallohydrolase 1 [Leptothrix discophora]|uniref:Quinoprotein relay system zinc metallohydrolase 1 n=1 Tax=Leptothrix discophora TaxID=89 RepID=A0ABT9FZL5_LEPDI|nr:quinoprotein relay system zinc metallohydrolase 1 [Leptothrix discophora]MDP4299610.1 quinoprotein relay system zinc metallohydrolase 1 [Leptothrix discophora]